VIYATMGKPGSASIFTIGQLGQAMPEAMAYNAHHFNCPQCIAAGRILNSVYRRCEIGAPLWHAYLQSVLSSPEASVSGGTASQTGLSSTQPRI
jgi:hypothetical protein